jgi:outer membrane protein OmpA-like peptidoglycan-associated protein
MHHAIVHDPPTLGVRAILGLLLRIGVVAGLLTAILAFPALSQQLGVRTFELNTFGRFTDFAPATNLQSGIGGGLRLGYFVHPRWELEGGVGFTRVDRVAGSEARNIMPLILDLTYNLPIGSNQLLLGGGAVHNDYGSYDAWGTSLTAGVRLPFGRSAALRVDGTREYINGGDTLRRHSNWGFRLGLSWMLPKASVPSEQITISRGELATVYPVPMPLLRESNPVTIMQLETDRAGRDSFAQGVAGVRVAGLRSIEMHDRMSMAIHFDVGSAVIRPDAIAALDTKLDLLRGIPAMRIRIEGQADARGSSASNTTLAWTRAEAAKRWLTTRGIASDRIDAVGFSSWRPICEDRQESCLWQNRRAEFVIVAGADADVPRTQ